MWDRVLVEMDSFEALNYIENALKTSYPNDDSYQTIWKPRIDAIRASIMKPELKKAMDHKPFDQLKS